MRSTIRAFWRLIVRLWESVGHKSLRDVPFRRCQICRQNQATIESHGQRICVDCENDYVLGRAV